MIRRLFQRQVPAPVIGLVLLVAASVIGYYMWRANGPRWDLLTPNHSLGFAKAMKNPAFRKQMLKKYPNMKIPADI